MEGRAPHRLSVVASPHTQASTSEDVGFTVRFFGYLLAVAGLFELGIIALKRWEWEAVYSEGGLAEWVQFALLTITGIGYLTLAWRVPRNRAVYLLLVVAAVFTVERELNYFLVLRETWACVIKHSSQVLLIGGVLLYWRKTIGIQLQQIARRPTFKLQVSGLLLVGLWAQILGQRTVWLKMYAPYALGKQFVEEQLEMAGYLLVFFSLVEELISLRAARLAATNDNLTSYPGDSILSVEAARAARNPDLDRTREAAAA